MSYDPLEPTIRDTIRRLVRDHSTIEAEEFFPDATYDQVLAKHPNWKRACAEMALSVAGVIENDPTSLGSDGDSLSWSNRTKSLYALHAQMLAEADADDDASASGTSAVPYMPDLIPAVWR
jgi:hypothetical protein